MAKREISDVEIRDLLDSVDSIQSELDKMKAKLTRIVGEEATLIPPDWERKRLKVWAKIHEKGDIVGRNDWEKIYTEVGYDPRGTGGFFSGPEASVVEIGEEKIALSKWAVEEVEKYKEWLKGEIKKK